MKALKPSHREKKRYLLLENAGEKENIILKTEMVKMWNRKL